MRKTAFALLLACSGLLTMQAQQIQKTFRDNIAIDTNVALYKQSYKEVVNIGKVEVGSTFKVNPELGFNQLLGYAATFGKLNNYTFRLSSCYLPAGKRGVVGSVAYMNSRGDVKEYIIQAEITKQAFLTSIVK